MLFLMAYLGCHGPLSFPCNVSADIQDMLSIFYYFWNVIIFLSGIYIHMLVDTHFPFPCGCCVVASVLMFLYLVSALDMLLLAKAMGLNTMFFWHHCVGSSSLPFPVAALLLDQHQMCLTPSIVILFQFRTSCIYHFG